MNEQNAKDLWPARMRWAAYSLAIIIGAIAGAYHTMTTDRPSCYCEYGKGEQQCRCLGPPTDGQSRTRFVANPPT